MSRITPEELRKHATEEDCGCTSSADKLLQAANDIEELERQVVIEKKKNQELSSAYSKRSSDLEKLRAGFNQAIELLVTALIEPEQITENEIYEFRTLELSVPKEQVDEEV